MRALLSVSDKRGIVEFAKELENLGVEIISTGGTYKKLKEEGVNVMGISDITGFSECLDGRVKTLHPCVHGGILARRDLEEHMDQLKNMGIGTIDIVVINLYPFKETIKKPRVTFEEVIENIDIGGPAMLRSAGKNHKDVTALCDYRDYNQVIEELRSGEVSLELKNKLALKVFQHTAAYDAMIAEYLRNYMEEELPDNLTITYEKVQDLRYGENSHQKAVYYKEIDSFDGALINARQLHGKELSFNNINDTHGALECLKEFSEPCVVAVKHANPCGVAIGDTLVDAYKKAHDCDPISIFGGIIACNREVDKNTAEEISKIFVEIVIAPKFSKEAMEVLMKKKNIRLLELPNILGKSSKRDIDIKKVSGGILVQDKDNTMIKELDVVTKKEPTEREKRDMEIAMKVVKHTRSNGIVFVKNGMTIGISPGQTNRIWAVENAIKQSNFDMSGAVMASDAFFPFDDCVTAAAEARISGIIQPGGSIRDQDSINKADEFEISMVFSGYRHFKH